MSCLQSAAAELQPSGAWQKGLSLGMEKMREAVFQIKAPHIFVPYYCISARKSKILDAVQHDPVSPTTSGVHFRKVRGA